MVIDAQHREGVGLIGRCYTVDDHGFREMHGIFLMGEENVRTYRNAPTLPVYLPREQRWIIVDATILDYVRTHMMDVWTLEEYLQEQLQRTSSKYTLEDTLATLRELPRAL